MTRREGIELEDHKKLHHLALTLNVAEVGA
jgi:hypothetical protein